MSLELIKKRTKERKNGCPWNLTHITILLLLIKPAVPGNISPLGLSSYEISGCNFSRNPIPVKI
jgi:hypothetical protein